jgi:DNA-binding winged helix-turn-helix (wHTH) protein
MTPDSGIVPEIDGMEEAVVCFGEFRLDLRLRSLHRGPGTVKLTPKPFATLAFLVENRRRVVSKEELLAKIWGGTRDVSTVEHAVGRLRRALGENSEEARYIETVPGQGYRFVADVHPLAERSIAALARQEPPKSEPEEAAGVAPAIATASASRVGSSARLFRRLPASAAVLVCLGVLGAVVAYIVIPDRVARGAWNGDTFVAMSDLGRVLWKYRFDAQLWEPPADDSAWRTQIVDLDGDGVPEVLVAAAFGPPGSGGKDELFCFSSSGTVLWRYKPKVDIEFSTSGLNGPWSLSDILVVPEKRSSTIWVAVVHDVWWPSFIDRLSPAGVRSRVFTSSGDIMALGRVQTRAGTYMLAAGVNNEYRQASLAILAENGPPTTSPQKEGSAFQCIRGCPAAKPYRYILLPRSELNAAIDRPYNIATQILTRPSGITVKTHDGSSVPPAFYDFSQELQPERVAYAGGYREMHERFEREGRIKHSFKDCPERKSPAILRICDDRGIWTTVKVPRVPMPD